MDTYMVIATFNTGTDMNEVMALIQEERAQVQVLAEEGRIGSIHLSLSRRTVFIEIFADDETSAAATVATLPMCTFWTLDVYPTPAPAPAAVAELVGAALVETASPAPASAVFTDTELAYLATQRLGRLATARTDGALQNSPVGFTVDAATGSIDISGFRLASSQKYRNIAANGRAAFVVDDIVSIEPWRVRCLEIRAVAEAVEIDGQALIRLHPQRVISFGLDEDREAHELTFHSRDVS